MRLIHIISGWLAFKRATQETQDRMASRLEICDKCENKEQIDGVTGAVVRMIDNDPRNLFRCGLCKCPLAALSSSPFEGCKAGKWSTKTQSI